MQKTIVHTMAKLVELSPVDTGRYLSNHRVGLNRIDTTVALVAPRRRGGRAAGVLRETLLERLRARAKRVAKSYQIGDTVFFSNSLGYAQKLEDGQHSAQAPAGVYRVAFQNLGSEVEEIGRGGVAAEL